MVNFFEWMVESVFIIKEVKVLVFGEGLGFILLFELNCFLIVEKFEN